jgi:two-component system alkaline phosphatase synthesis response regulator PhoP
MNAAVLVVDDERDFVELMQFRLEEKGYRVLVADNGLAAIDQARRFLPKLILLDLMMPGLNGFSVCEILRRHPVTKNIPVMMLTAVGGQMARLNGMVAGADDYVLKTVPPSEILQRVEHWVHQAPDRPPGIIEVDGNPEQSHVVY